MCQPTKIIEYHKTHREPVLDAETIALGKKISQDPEKALELLVSTGMYDKNGRQTMQEEAHV
jgi:hypothetical protein